MRSPRHRRIGDEDRERASTELRARYRDGLIGHDDFLARLDRVWRASRVCALQRAVAAPPMRAQSTSAQSTSAQSTSAESTRAQSTRANR